MHDFVIAVEMEMDNCPHQTNYLFHSQKWHYHTLHESCWHAGMLHKRIKQQCYTNLQSRSTKTKCFHSYAIIPNTSTHFLLSTNLHMSLIEKVVITATINIEAKCSYLCGLCFFTFHLILYLPIWPIDMSANQLLRYAISN
jgi:hypothetical protein